MTPYYEHAGVTIYHGDCREILPQLGEVESVIVDPPWPNLSRLLRRDGLDPVVLLREMFDALVSAVRVVIHLGCTSDPRILAAVPERWPFFRVSWLRYACPSYAGRALLSGDVAYAFGAPVPSAPRRRVVPGEVTSVRNEAEYVRGYGKNRSPATRDLRHEELSHPTPRHLAHVRWLVAWFSESEVVDPFCGSGTTLVAAKTHGRRATGIEIEERYCEIAARRLGQEVLPFGAANS